MVGRTISLPPGSASPFSSRDAASVPSGAPSLRARFLFRPSMVRTVPRHGQTVIVDLPEPSTVNVQDAAYATVHDYPGGAAALAVRLGCNAAVLGNKVRPTCPAHHLTLEESVRIQDLTGDHRILRAMCETFGYLDPIPSVEYAGLADAALLEIVGRVHAEGGDVSRTLVGALADGEISAADLVDIEREVREAMGALAELLDRVRGMVRDRA